MKDEKVIERVDGNLWFRFLFGTIPYTGGALGAVALKAQRCREARLNALLEGLREDVQRIGQEAVRREYLDTEEFYALLEFTWQQVSQSADEKKLRYLRAYILGVISKRAPDIALQDLFRKHLLNMSGSHLAVVEQFHAKQGRYSATDRAHFATRIDGEIPLTLEDLAAELDQFPTELLRALCLDLAALGLLGDWALTHPGEKVQRSFYLTDNGLQFMQFMNDTMASMVPSSTDWKPGMPAR